MSHRILQILQRSKHRGLTMAEVLQRCSQLGMTNESVRDALAALLQASVITISDAQVNLTRDDAEIARLRHAVCLRCGRSDLLPRDPENISRGGLSEEGSLQAGTPPAPLVFGYCPACRLVVTWK